jgi:hypothetical protein
MLTKKALADSILLKSARVVNVLGFSSKNSLQDTIPVAMTKEKMYLIYRFI